MSRRSFVKGLGPVLLLIAGLLSPIMAARGDIRVVAGDGLGDGSPATDRWLPLPYDASVDAAGRLYTIDRTHGRVYRLGLDGSVVTVAGGGALAPENAQDHRATEVDFSSLSSAAADPQGNLFLATYGHVWRVSPDGQVTRVVGVLPSTQFDFAAFADARLADGKPAVQASLRRISRLVVDSGGSLYLAEVEAHRVRKVTPDGIITTVAGYPATRQTAQAAPDDVGDGRLATDAPLSWPRGLAVDDRGDLFIADAGHHRVCKVTPDGIITTVAGAGTPGSDGDGGPATQARLRTPYAVTVDPGGGLYIADRASHRVRRVDPSGVITTVAGTGSPGFSGDGGPALQAQLQDPEGISVLAAGTLLIADTQNNRLRRVGPDGIITTIAGVGARAAAGEGDPTTIAALAAPAGLARDGAGFLYVADTHNDRIRRISLGGTLTTVAGGGAPSDGLGDNGPAVAAALDGPRGVVVGRDGSLYIADTGHHRVRKVTTDGVIATVVGTGDPPGEVEDGIPAIQATLSFPADVALGTDGSLYIADTDHNQVRRVDPNGRIFNFAGIGSSGRSGDGGPAAGAELNQPQGVAADRTGTVYIADTGNRRICRVTPDGVIATVLDLPNPYRPIAVKVNSNGDLFVGASGNVLKIGQDLSLSVLSDQALERFGLDATDHLYYQTRSSGLVRQAPDGTQTALPLTIAPAVLGVGADPAGQLYIPASGFHDKVTELPIGYLYRVNPDGTAALLAGDGRGGFGGDGGPATRASLSFYFTNEGGLAADGQGNVFIADSDNDRIRRINPSGTITTVAGSAPGAQGEGGPAVGVPLMPTDLAIDASGDLLILDRMSARVRRLASDGILHTVVGGRDERMLGPAGLDNGDGGPAVMAVLNNPVRIHVDSQGTLSILESNGIDPDRIRQVGPDGTIMTLPPAATVPWDPLDAQGNRFYIDPAQGLNQVLEQAGTAPLGPVPGDVNGDGRVDLRDALLALQAAVGAIVLTPDQTAAADVSGDGRVTLQDATLILRRAIGL